MALKLNYIIAMDFEATCDLSPIPVYRRESEIIEFPAVLMNLNTGIIENEFQRYVRPIEKPILTDYCKNLTGITQYQVDRASILSDVLNEFNGWINLICIQKNLKLPGYNNNNNNNQTFVTTNNMNSIIHDYYNCVFVTWGNDFDYFLHKECKRKSIMKPSYFKYWINLKDIFIQRFSQSRKISFEKSLQFLNIKFIGRQHSGLDDAKNTAILCYEMKKRSANLRITNQI